MDSYFDNVRKRNSYKIGLLSVKEGFVIQPQYGDIQLYKLHDIYIYVVTLGLDSIKKSSVYNLYRLKDKELLIKDVDEISVIKFGKSYIFKVEKDEKYTLLDENFKTIIPFSEHLSIEGNELSEGYKPKLFVASLPSPDKTENMGIYDNSGKLLMRDILFKNRVFNYVTNQEFFCIQKNRKYGLIDSECKLLVPYKSEIKLEIPHINYPEIPILIKENGKYGYINSLFLDKLVTPTIYDNAKPFNDLNGSPEADVSLNGKWGILNGSGKYIISPNSLEPVSSLDFKKYVVKRNNGYYLLENKLSEEKTLLGPFDSFEIISENYLFTVVNNKKKIVNFADYKISNESFDEIKASRENIIVINNGQEMVFDTERMKIK